MYARSIRSKCAIGRPVRGPPSPHLKTRGEPRPLAPWRGLRMTLFARPDCTSSGTVLRARDGRYEGTMLQQQTLLGVTFLILGAAGCEQDKPVTRPAPAPPPTAPAPPAPAAIAAPVPALIPEPPAVPRSTMPSLEKGVILTVVPELDETRHVTVRGETNLPDGVELFVSVKEPGGFGDEFEGEAVKVTGGRYIDRDFGPSSGLLDGEYGVEVMMYDADEQPEAVRAFLGEGGRNLRGKLVRRDDLTTTVVATAKFVVGDPSTAKAAASQRRKKTRAFLLDSAKQIERIVRAGLADGDRGLDDTGACMRRARREWAIVDPMKERLDELGDAMPGVMSLSVAAAHARTCASCADRDARNCEEAKESLAEARKDFRSARL
jgi:hypothetical protein